MQRRHTSRVVQVITTLSAIVVVAFVAACPPKPTDAPVPPAGLAGGGGPAAPSGLALPGAGAPVPEPSGAAGLALPPGHPPVDGVAPESGPAAPGAATRPATPLALPASLTGSGAPAAGPAAAPETLSGSVLETMNVPEYTYMRLRTASGEEWVAVNQTAVAVGDTVTVASNVVMENFPSRTLGRTFARLTMGTLIDAPRKP